MPEHAREHIQTQLITTIAERLVITAKNHDLKVVINEDGTIKVTPLNNKQEPSNG